MSNRFVIALLIAASIGSILGSLHNVRYGYQLFQQSVCHRAPPSVWRECWKRKIGNLDGELCCGPKGSHCWWIGSYLPGSGLLLLLGGKYVCFYVDILVFSTCCGFIVEWLLDGLSHLISTSLSREWSTYVEPFLVFLVRSLHCIVKANWNSDV